MSSPSTRRIAEAADAGPETDGWRRWAVRLAPGKEPADLLQHCTARGFALRRFEQRRPGLHDVFLHIVGGAEDRS